MPDSDWHLAELYSFAHELDCTIISANYNRLVIDLNRPPDDQALYPDQPGSALCPEILFDGNAVYYSGNEPDDSETERRLRQYWIPYHETLQEQLIRIKAEHGYAILYDCHSIAGQAPRLFDGTLPDLNLGTNRGRSCAIDLEQKIAAQLQRSPFSHVVNGRFIGGYITRRYGDPDNQVHAMQMELNQSAYMDDSQVYKPELAQDLQRELHEILQILIHWKPGQATLL